MRSARRLTSSIKCSYPTLTENSSVRLRNARLRVLPEQQQTKRLPMCHCSTFQFHFIHGFFTQSGAFQSAALKGEPQYASPPKKTQAHS